jgi:hypothetical protein
VVLAVFLMKPVKRIEPLAKPSTKAAIEGQTK